MFPSSYFWFLVTFGDKVTKILHNLCLHFARQDGQDRKKQIENHATKVTKIPKTKRPKYVMNKKVVAKKLNLFCGDLKRFGTTSINNY